MIDITKEEFWDSKYGEVNKIEKKNNKIKDFIIEHKMISALLMALTLLMLTNTILIYNFFRLLSNI